MEERVLTVLGNKASRPISDFMLGIAGTEYYVGPNATGAGDDGRAGRSKETSLATWAKAVTLVTASKNDIIYLLPGYAETFSTAAAVNLSKIGVRTIGIGTGALRPTVTFSATEATITMTAASCSIDNVIVIPSTNAVVSPFVVSAPDCRIDVEVQDASDSVEFVRAVLTTADADRLKLKIKHIGRIGGSSCEGSVRLVGCDTAEIDMDFYGVAQTGIIEFHTTASHNIDIKGRFYCDGTSLTKNVVESVGSNTWNISGWDGEAAAAFAGGDNQTPALADIETLASDLVIMDALVDTIKSDLIILDAIINVLDPITVTIASDLVIIDALIDTEVGKTATIASDLVVMDALIDTEVGKTTTIASDLILVDTVVDKIVSDLIVLDAIVDTEVGKTTTIASDLIILDAIVDGEVTKTTTIASDLILVDTVVDGLAAFQPRTVINEGIPLDENNQSDIFVITGGPVIVTELFIILTEACSAHATLMAFVADPDGGSDTDITLSGGAATPSGVDLVSAAIGDMVYAEMDGTVAVIAATGTALPTWGGTARMVIPVGGIDLDFDNDTLTSGIATAYITYIPTSAASVVS